MAAGATMYRFKIALSDVDRGVYEQLDVRAAQHPSETERNLVTRILAYSLLYEEGLAFSRGLSTTEEPAIWLKDPIGDVKLWVDVGAPSADRLTKATRIAPRVVVATADGPDRVIREARGKIHKEERVEILAIDPQLVRSIEERLDRNLSFELTVTDGQLYVVLDGKTFEGPTVRHALAEP